ncbi:hypothetical protein J2Y56_002140 [Pseudomonas sp. BE134]|nr:hypothetical protein [Pseudomonas sp. BE134]
MILGFIVQRKYKSVPFFWGPLFLGQMGHLAGDVPALFIVAVALAILTPRSQLAARPRTHNGA